MGRRGIWHNRGSGNSYFVHDIREYEYPFFCGRHLASYFVWPVPAILATNFFISGSSNLLVVSGS